MMTRRLWQVCAAFVVLVGVLCSRAGACSCYESGPPCQAAWSADIVFTGIVRAIDQIDHVDLGPPYRNKLVQFEVERPFRNAAIGRLEVVTGSDGAACGYDFKIGTRYLVYAWKTAGTRLATGICSRTRALDDAAEDLQYLTTIPAASDGARVFGRIKQVEWDPGVEVSVDYGPVEVPVLVQGVGFARVVDTNEHGRYELAGVPPGKYTVAVLAPPEFNPRDLRRDVEVKDARGCAQADFDVQRVPYRIQAFSVANNPPATAEARIDPLQASRSLRLVLVPRR